MKYKYGNYLQLLFVFAAFAIMVLTAYFSIGRILRNQLLNGTKELLMSAEANVKAGLSEAEVTLLNSYYVLQGMIERDATSEELLDYLHVTTEWMRRRTAGLLDFYGIYGFINGEFFDGLGMNPDSDFIPQTRPWYQVAIRSSGQIAYTTPYIDWHTGDTVVSAVRTIDIKGEMIGILAVDIKINWLLEYVSSLALADDGFGMLLSQNLIFMAYPDVDYLGKQLQELGGAFEGLARNLRAGEEVFARRIIDPDRGPVIVFLKQIFNDWYVGIVTPSSQFYMDLKTSAQILVLLGVLLSFALCLILVRLSAAKQRSDEESREKSSFLARMSHEIRTPLNAVIGLSGIVLNRGELSSESKSDILQIHQSGTSLLGIINDILDISKIEAGGFELIPVEYDTASFINDTINMNKVRIGEKPISLLLKIDKEFPAKLIGDELRVRQILNNLLSNAIKYTKEGTIKLIISKEQITEAFYEDKIFKHKAAADNKDMCLIRFIVSDTGIGIRSEDVGKLFSEYTQLDTGLNRKIEGTGLGLSITKKLVEMMGGSIIVESEYGKGSVFSVTLVQELASSIPIGEETAENLKQFKYFTPINEKIIDRGWMPSSRVLVVDDMSVNLQVARGLLFPYGLSVDTAESGQEAIELIHSGKKYDLVFMDYMMPEMDGIETVKIIRAWEKTEAKDRMPIVALTANALAGNNEMFMSKDFDGFIPKPIDIAQLDEVLNQWISSENKKENHNMIKEELDGSVSIKGVDIQRGIAMTGGTMSGYFEVLAIYYKDSKDRLSMLENLLKEDTLTKFVTHVHALKSASSSIGASDVSALAAELEAAGKAGDTELINKKLPGFMEKLTELVNNIQVGIEKYEAETKSSALSTAGISVPLLNDLKIALEAQEANEINKLLKELRDESRKQSLDSSTKEAIEQISDEVMMVEYDNAKEIVEKLMEQYGN